MYLYERLETKFTKSWDRDYNPDTGRFLTEDPIGFAGGDINLYRYVGNSPSHFIDPLGLIRLPPGFGATPLPGSGRFLPLGTPADLFEKSQEEAENSLLPGASGGPQDAFRHCVASCAVRSAYGSSLAETLGDLNEIRGEIKGQSCQNRRMDQSNNAVGRELGNTVPSNSELIGSCSSQCLGALKLGQLQTLR